MKVPSDILNNALFSDEIVLWSGKPSISKIFNIIDWILIPVGIIWMSSGIYGLTFIIDSMNRTSTIADNEMLMQFMRIMALIISAIFSALGMYLLVFRFIVKAFIKSKSQYAITNRRILIIQKGPFSRMKSVEANTIAHIEMSEFRHGKGTIFFFRANSIIKAISTMILDIPWLYWHSKKYIFFDIAEINGVKAIVYDFISKKGDFSNPAV